MNTKLHNMLGLCMRAGKMQCGADISLSAIRAGTAKLLIVDAAASANTQKMMCDACAYRNVQLLTTESDLLGSAIGKPGRMVAAITDAGFAKAIAKAVEEDK